MIDILADARKWLAGEGIGERMGRTHGEECHRWHLTCLVSRLADEVESLRKKDESPSRLSAGDKCDYAYFEADIVRKEVYVEAVRPTVQNLRKLATWIGEAIKWMERQ